MLMSYPLSSKRVSIDFSKKVDVFAEISKLYMDHVKTMTMSRSLLDRLSQHCIHRQFHHQPVGNSIIVPERLASGEVAFLNVSKSTSYKPIIFDCTSLAKIDVINKIDEKISSVRWSGITGVSSGRELEWQIRRGFCYWLAAHHKNDTTSPLWLFGNYRYHSETDQPYDINHLTCTSKFGPVPELELPPERIKEYFNQPSAVVLQKDDLLALLDEFLSLISTKKM